MNLYQCERCEEFTEDWKHCKKCLNKIVKEEVDLGAELILSMYDKNKKINGK